MISSEASANATSSARRMSGGRSSALSGTGAPSWLLEGWLVEELRSPGGDLLDERSLGNALLGNSLPGNSLLGNSLLGAPRTMLLPRAKRQCREAARELNSGGTTSYLRRRFHRGIVSACFS